MQSAQLNALNALRLASNPHYRPVQAQKSPKSRRGTLQGPAFFRRNNTLVPDEVALALAKKTNHRNQFRGRSNTIQLKPAAVGLGENAAGAERGGDLRDIMRRHSLLPSLGVTALENKKFDIGQQKEVGALGRLSPRHTSKFKTRGNSVFQPTTRFDKPKPNGKFQQRNLDSELTWRYCQNMTIPDYGD